MRCVACNVILTPQESVRRFKESRAFVDMCNKCLSTISDEIPVAEGSLNEGQYEMMMRNGQVKKFIAKDDTDAKRIAAGHGAKSVIRMKGNVPGDKIWHFK